jgi:hypothetical protein
VAALHDRGERKGAAKGVRGCRKETRSGGEGADAGGRVQAWGLASRRGAACRRVRGRGVGKEGLLDEFYRGREAWPCVARTSRRRQRRAAS